MTREFTAKRLSENLFTIEKGRRQFIATGKLDDYFFVDTIKGVVNKIEDVLAYYAVQKGYDIVLILDSQMNPRFPNERMKRLYSEIADKDSVDQEAPANSVGWSDESVISSASKKSGTSQKEKAVEKVTQNSVTREKSILDKILNRLLPSQYKVYVIFRDPESILHVQNGNLTPESQARLSTIIGWAEPKDRGHALSCSVLLISDTFLQPFTNFCDALSVGHKEWTTNIRIGMPDMMEIESLLIRLQCRYGLTGNPKVVANRLFERAKRDHEGLFSITSIIGDAMRKTPQPTSLNDIGPVDPERQRILDDAMQELDALIGLGPVKDQVKKLIALAKLQKEELEAGEELSSHNLNCLFLGNPGTGKTMVARILGKIYYGLGLRTSKKCIEISMADVAGPQNSNQVIEKMRAKINEAMGGVLFVDEIYSFAEGSEFLRKGFEVLMKDMEDHRDNLTVIGAGYRDKLPKLYAINEGIKSRFPTQNYIDFPDYSTEELIQIADFHLSQKKYSLTDKGRKKLVEYIESREYLGGIGNGRGVRDLVGDMIVQASIHGQGKMIDANSIPDPIMLQEEKAKQIREEMDRNLMGLENLKEYMKLLFANRVMDLKKKRFTKNTFHLALLGNPGTGKTTVVDYLSKFFHYLGVTSLTNVVHFDIQSHAHCVREKFEEARGGILFIDEAYKLTSCREALDQIVQLMTEKKYRDLVVIAAGYTHKMQELFKENIGFADRFHEHILFENFSPLQLEQIFMKAMKNDQSKILPEEEEHFKTTLHRELRRLRRDPEFANARSVEKFFSKVSGKRAMRCLDHPGSDNTVILAADVKTVVGGDRSVKDILDELNRDFVGLESVKEQIADLARGIEADERLGISTNANMHNMRFVGNPGTGKTTIARKMAEVFNAIGLIDGKEVLEVSATDLKAPYIGQSSERVLKVFEQARKEGKVLFIDEAPGLYPKDVQQDSFNTDIIKAIITETTREYNAGVVTILAGYPDAMDHLMTADAGFLRRFPNKVVFPNYNVEECLQILFRYITSEKKRNIDESQRDRIENCLRSVITKMISEPQFGNAGTMRNLGEKIINILNKKSSYTLTLDAAQQL